MIVAVDSGTTSTRAWVLEDGEVKASSGSRGGARDLVRTKDRRELLGRVRRLADDALASAGATWDGIEAVVAFGMITSELGLEEVPHLRHPSAAARSPAPCSSGATPTHCRPPYISFPGFARGATISSLPISCAGRRRRLPACWQSASPSRRCSTS